MRLNILSRNKTKITENDVLAVVHGTRAGGAIERLCNSLLFDHVDQVHHEQLAFAQFPAGLRLGRLLGKKHNLVFAYEFRVAARFLTTGSTAVAAALDTKNADAILRA